MSYMSIFKLISCFSRANELKRTQYDFAIVRVIQLLLPDFCTHNCAKQKASCDHLSCDADSYTSTIGSGKSLLMHGLSFPFKLGLQKYACIELSTWSLQLARFQYCQISSKSHSIYQLGTCQHYQASSQNLVHVQSIKSTRSTVQALETVMFAPQV